MKLKQLCRKNMLLSVNVFYDMPPIIFLINNILKSTILFSSLIVSFEISAAPEGQTVISYPTQYCHALQRENDKALSDVTDPAYSKIQKQIRWDIVCIGDTIHIYSPIRSNGGDVIIFANKIEFSAPIDSRPYINPNDYSHYLDDDNRYSGISEAKVVMRNSWIKNIYDDYYSRSLDGIKIGEDKVFLPEKPSGLTGKAFMDCGSPSEDDIKRLSPSTPPPVISERDNLNPGLIKIYANDYTFLEKPLSSYSLYNGDPLLCNEKNNQINGKVFIARGLRGGRGGAGATTSYFNDTGTNSGSVRFSCVRQSYENPGLLNVSGGPGGDGGNVVLVLVGKTKSDTSNELERRTSVEGGPPGSVQKIRSPSWTGPNAATTNNVCGLKSEGQWPSSANGINGKLYIVKKNQTDALLDFFGDIASRDARPDYNYLELIERAKIPAEKIKAFTFSGFAERRFYEILSLFELSWLERLNGLITTFRDDKSPVIDGVWESLNLKKLDESVMANGAVQPLRLISSFNSRQNSGAVKSYLMNTGGMFNLRSSSTVQQWNSLASRTEATLSAVKLEQIKASLSKIAESVNDIREVVKSNEFRDELSALQEKLKLVQEAAEKAKSTHNMENTMSALRDVAQGIVMLVGAYESGDASTAGGGVIKLKGGLDKLMEPVQGTQKFDAEITRLNSLILGLSNQFDSFIEYSTHEKDEIISEKHQNIVDYFEANTSYGARLEARCVLFHDLIRTMLIGYFLDPSKSTVEIKTNLVALYTLLKDYPAREPTFTLRDIELSCGLEKNNRDKCINIRVTRKIAILKSRSLDWTNGLPLYVVVDPISKNISLPSYGALWKLESTQLSNNYSSVGYKPLGNWMPDSLFKASSKVSVSK